MLWQLHSESNKIQPCHQYTACLLAESLPPSPGDTPFVYLFIPNPVSNRNILAIRPVCHASAMHGTLRPNERNTEAAAAVPTGSWFASPTHCACHLGHSHDARQRCVCHDQCPSLLRQLCLCTRSLPFECPRYAVMFVQGHYRTTAPEDAASGS